MTTENNGALQFTGTRDKSFGLLSEEYKDMSIVFCSQLDFDSKNLTAKEIAPNRFKIFHKQKPSISCLLYYIVENGNCYLEFPSDDYFFNKVFSDLFDVLENKYKFNAVSLKIMSSIYTIRKLYHIILPKNVFLVPETDEIIGLVERNDTQLYNIMYDVVVDFYQKYPSPIGPFLFLKEGLS